MEDIMHKSGFLGTHANFAADITLLLLILVIALFTFGFWLARRQQYEAHRWVQTSAAALNAVMVVWMMLLPFRDFILRDQGGPRPVFFYSLTVLHAIAGSIALPFGIFVVLRGNNLVPKALRFRNYKVYMRLAYGLYLLATALGVVVYFIWFVLIPNPPHYQ